MADLSTNYEWKSIFLNMTKGDLDEQLNVELNRLDQMGWKIHSIFPSSIKPGGHPGLLVIAKKQISK